MKSIFIFGKQYSINYVDAVDHEDNSGECNIRAGEIRILNTLSEAQKNDTLLHEILHIISDELCLGMSERQVTAMAVGLYAVYKENNIIVSTPGV